MEEQNNPKKLENVTPTVGDQQVTAAAPNQVIAQHNDPAQPSQLQTPMPKEHDISGGPEKQRPIQNNKKVSFAIIVLVLFILVLAGIIIYVATKKDTVNPSPPPPAPQSIQPGGSPQSSNAFTNTPNVNSSAIEAQNVNRKNDAAEIDAAMAQYYANNGGVLPTATRVLSGRLHICGASCYGKTNVPVLNLAYYSPVNVSINPYQAGLTARDAETVYIVTNALCASPTSIGLQGRSNDYVILFALQEPNGVLQQCIEK
ncbi:MAG TPA: hypothetical protein VLG47_04210 [Candidatus Saccharimonadales bacterium]|nr:hypothetical protein [Candidatus Saccharimonadales bacterium]